MKILIMGLPGSGKTYLAERIQPLIDAAWYNAYFVRNMANGWEFSSEGKIKTRRWAREVLKHFQEAVLKQPCVP